MKLIQLLFFCFLYLNSFSQSIERKIINSAGTVYNNGIRLKVSVGEPIVGRIDNDSVTILSQGFFTGFYKKSVSPPSPPPVDTSGPANPVPDGYSIYPNPVQNIIYIRGDISMVNKVEFFDITGRRLFAQKPGYGGSINVQFLPPGFYVGVLSNKSGELMNVFKIVKL